ncbi:MAG: hypothetical protein AAGK71_10265 [Pseudomonadota bacterium]
MTLSRLASSICAFALSAGLTHAETAPSFGALEFGLDDTLFVADSAAGTITAYDLPNDGVAPEGDRAFNLLDVDALAANALGADGRILYNDLAVHPVTRAAYVSVSTTVGGSPTSAVMSITVEGEVAVLDLASIPSSTFSLAETADAQVSFWRDIPAPSLTITDLDFVNGELFISGLSTGEFASTLRRVAYPFDAPETASSIEMFHAAHGQNETRAPIRAMSVVDLDGAATVVAAYTCTPLVTIPVESLQDGAHIVGKTIAELGYGNRPLDVIPFSAANMQGEVESYVLVVNREMDADLISMEALKAAADAPGLSEPIPYLGATVGVETIPLPLSGVVHAADQDTQFLLAMRRDLETGAMELVSFRKGAFFRLSDFISEYNFPDYAYSEEAQGLRMFQNMLKADEGFPDQIVQ